MNTIKSLHPTNKKWWHDKVAYQIYPKSFLDTNGDGIGDLRGIISKLDYLKELGVDIIWLSPIYKSPFVDQGYDISDYYAIAEEFGTMEEFDELLAESKKRGISIIMDLVINHCSDKHEWFKKALADPDGEYADYFFFREGKNGNPPSNYRSYFGGSCWEPVPNSNKYYLHMFAKEQPDLNWENPTLLQKLYDMINWWLEKGIAGFRIDAITFIKKDLSFSSRSMKDGERYPVENLTDYPGIGVFLDEMKERCFEKYNCMTVAEAPGVDNQAFERYAGKNGYFSMIFDFGWENMEDEKDKSSIDAIERWKRKIFKNVSNNSKIGWSAIFLENHDQSRCVNKFLEKENINFYSASALASIYFYLYGTPFVYQGQEIGMTNVEWKDINDMEDVRAKRTYQEAVEQGKDPQEMLAYFSELGRDNARTPMQWTSGKNGGFSESDPWIKCNDNYTVINVENQIKDTNSLYHYYKSLIQYHHKHTELLKKGLFKPVLEEYPGLIAYERSYGSQKLTVVVNFTNSQMKISKMTQKCVLCNYKNGETAQMQPYEARIYYRE